VVVEVDAELIAMAVGNILEDACDEVDKVGRTE
jgi:hypothetical protein